MKLEKIEGLGEYYKRHTFKDTCERFGLPFTSWTQAKMAILWPKNGPGSVREKRNFIKVDLDIEVYTGKALKKLRKECAMTRAEVAGYLGMNTQYLAQIEQGKHGLTRDNIYYLSCLFGVCPSRFFPPIKLAV